jgi:hypothetical protein
MGDGAGVAQAGTVIAALIVQLLEDFVRPLVDAFLIALGLHAHAHLRPQPAQARANVRPAALHQLGRDAKLAYEVELPTHEIEQGGV